MTLLDPTARGTTQLVSMQSPQQVNGHDCGMYVLCIAELLCATADQAQTTEAIRALTPEAVVAKRAAFRDMVIGSK